MESARRVRSTVENLQLGPPLIANDGQEDTPLWSEAEIANGEFIADLQLPKSAYLSNPCTGFCIRGEKNPAVLIGTSKAPIVFGPDKVKLGKWYRFRLKLNGRQATATLSETQEATPQALETTLECPTKGLVGIAEFGTPVAFANFFIREQLGIL